MPIIIWGSRGLRSERDHGFFYCPRCDGDREYRLMQIRPFFTIYFIPIFPIGRAQRYVECETCGQTYQEAVLEMEAPSEGDRLLRRLHQELRGGSSLETVSDKLVKMGMDRARAEEILEQMSEGKTWSCGGCGERYLASVKKCPQCRA